MIEHGLRSSYQKGCRCLPCRAANAGYVSPGPLVLVDAAPVRAHLRWLQSQGIGRHRVAELAGCSAWHVQSVCSGAVSRIGSNTASRLLAVRPSPARGALVDSWPCRRLLDRLCREGYTPETLRQRFGVRGRPVRRRVRASTAARIFAAHRRALGDVVDSPECEPESHTT